MVVSVLWSRSGISLPLPFTVPAQALNGIRIFTTFNLVCFAWIFFRAESIADAFYISQHLFVNLDVNASLFELMPVGGYDWLIALLGILLMETIHWQQRKNGRMREVFRRQPTWLRWSAYYALVLVIFMFGKFGSGEFNYARF